MAEKNRFTVSGGFADVFSLLHIDHAFNSHHTKEEPWNSLMKAVAPRFLKTASPPLPLISIA